MENNQISCIEAKRYIYFEIEKRIHPESIIDIGLFLQQIGALSRKNEAYEIETGVEMTAVNTSSQEVMPIYRRIYDSIISIGELHNYMPVKKIELAYFFIENVLLSFEEKKQIWTWMREHVKYVLISENEKTEMVEDDCQIMELFVNGNQFYLCTFRG